MFKNGSNPSENKEENVRRILLLLGVIVYFTACKERQGDYILRVSFSGTVYTIDVVRDTLIDSVLYYYFPYDTTSATFKVEAYSSEENYTPVIVIDSYRIDFYDLSQNPPAKISFNVASPYQDSVSIDRYSYLMYKVRTEVQTNEELRTTIPILPSYIKHYYNPFYQLWRYGNPKVLFLKAVYTFYSHELFSGNELDPVNAEITLEVSDYGG